MNQLLDARFVGPMFIYAYVNDHQGVTIDRLYEAADGLQVPS